MTVQVTALKLKLMMLAPIKVEQVVVQQVLMLRKLREPRKMMKKNLMVVQ